MYLHPKVDPFEVITKLYVFLSLSLISTVRVALNLAHYMGDIDVLCSYFLLLNNFVFAKLLFRVLGSNRYHV